MPVCITGMHRSGTSMVTKFLSEGGLYLGLADRLMPAATENQEGFWEHLDIVELNDEILNQLGGGWDCPPPEPPDWTAGPLVPLRPRAEAILEPLAERDPWGWKDPRASLTLPFWRSLLPDLRTVVVVRHPLEVALSLRQRNGFSFALGLTLWEITNRRLLAATTPENRVVTHFDAWFGDPSPEIGRLGAFVGLDPGDGTPAGSREGATASLRHHRLTTHDLLDADVSQAILDLYRGLCDEAGWRDTDGRHVSPGSRQITQPIGRDAGDEAPHALELGVGRTNRALLEVRALQRELTSYRRSLELREERVTELEGALRVHEETAVTRDATIADLSRAVEREAQAAAERDEVARELTALRLTVGDQAEHIDLLGQRLQTVSAHEEEVRTLLASAHEQLAQRDAEVLGTLGAVLRPHAPGAPSAIYYRQLVEKTAALVAGSLPPATPTLVLSGGDEAMLALDGRPAWHFPNPETDDGSDGDGAAAIAQLEMFRQRGAGFLVVPASGRAWLARYPNLQRYLRRYSIVASDETVAHVYGLADAVGAPP